MSGRPEAPHRADGDPAGAAAAAYAEVVLDLQVPVLQQSSGPRSSIATEIRAVQGLPLPMLSHVARNDGVRCVVTPVGRDGRLADRSVLTLMGWSETQTVALTVEPGPVVAIRPGQGLQIGSRYQLRLSLAIRRRCGIAPGDRLLVVAYRPRAEVVVIPMPVLDDLIAAVRSLHDRQPRS